MEEKPKLGSTLVGQKLVDLFIETVGKDNAEFDEMPSVFQEGEGILEVSDANDDALDD